MLFFAIFGAQISIHALLAESDCPVCQWRRSLKISIHALLAESDNIAQYTRHMRRSFLSTLSLRRATTDDQTTTNNGTTFLSTLSLRRATLLPQPTPRPIPNFYPRSPCGERPRTISCPRKGKNFYPRSPCGERRGHDIVRELLLRFLSTLSLRRATL